MASITPKPQKNKTGHVAAFCGAEIAASLSDRLDAHELVKYRERLGRFYRHVVVNAASSGLSFEPRHGDSSSHEPFGGAGLL